MAASLMWFINYCTFHRYRNNLNTCWAAALTGYFVLSGLCFIAGDIVILRNSIKAMWKWIWVLGPPASLLYQTNFAWMYFLGSSVVAVSTLVSRLVFTQGSDWFVFAILFTVLMWFAFGAMAYAPVT